MTNPLKRNKEPDENLSEYEKNRRERIAANKKRRRRALIGNVLTKLAIGILAVVLIAALLVGVGLITMLAWNYGVIVIAAAVSTAAWAKISLGTAICTNFALGILGTLLHGGNVEIKKSS